MERKRKLVVAKAAVLLGAIPIALWAWEYGPEAGHAGVPGELGACNSAGCHVGTALNGGGGSVSISFPNGLSYTPGVAQQLTVTVSDAKQKAWGFQVTARQTSSSTTMAGTFASVDANTQVICSIPSLDPNSIQPVLNFPGSQDCPSGQPLAYMEHSLTGYNATFNKPGSGTYTFTWTPPSTNVGKIDIYVAGNAANGDVTVNGDHVYTAKYTLTPAGSVTFSNTYYFPHFALGGGWQSVLTYVNYSQQSVTCQTTFYSNTGALLPIPFGGAAASIRTDTLAPGGDLHSLSTAGATPTEGWAEGQCTGPVKASMLFRLYNSQGAATTEAGVNASTTPATNFVTYAQTATGIAYANPSPTQQASITFLALDSTGKVLGSHNVILPPGGHASDNVINWLNQNFTGSVQITSTVPIIVLSLNAEAFTQQYPVVSSLPPGDEGDTATTYYFPHFALGGGWQSVLTYVNYSQQSVTCHTTFNSNTGAPLPIPFGGAASSSRTDVLATGAEIHSLSTAGATPAEGWAQGQCTGPVKASMLFRLYNGQNVATTEAGVNAATIPATKFVTYAQSATGLAYANPSTTQSASITFLALDTTGAVLGTHLVVLPPGGHASENVINWLNQNFTGSVQIISTVPIIVLSLNAEVFTQQYPVISSLPPGDLDGSTQLSTGH